MDGLLVGNAVEGFYVILFDDRFEAIDYAEHHYPPDVTWQVIPIRGAEE